MRSWARGWHRRCRYHAKSVLIGDGMCRGREGQRGKCEEGLFHNVTTVHNSYFAAECKGVGGLGAAVFPQSLIRR